MRWGAESREGPAAVLSSHWARGCSRVSKLGQYWTVPQAPLVCQSRRLFGPTRGTRDTSLCGLYCPRLRILPLEDVFGYPPEKGNSALWEWIQPCFPWTHVSEARRQGCKEGTTEDGDQLSQQDTGARSPNINYPSDLWRARGNLAARPYICTYLLMLCQKGCWRI